MFDITSIGEVLIDFSSIDAPEGKLGMMGSTGGAPCNVLAQAGKLGATTSFIGAIGQDMFGSFIKRELKKYGIDMTALAETGEATTTLAIVFFDEEGDRSFDFVRAPGADSMLTMNDKVREVLGQTKLLQYGSLSMSKEPARSAVFEILEYFKGPKAYDPNLRPAIWKDDEAMRRYAREGMKYADILKLGDDEAMFIMEQPDEESAVRSIQEEFHIPLIFVTKGKHGCRFYYKGESGFRPAYPVKTVDTTGAGDAFFGALLYCLINGSPMDQLTMEQIGDYVAFANAAGGLSATRKGTMEAMPYREEMERLLAEGV